MTAGPAVRRASVVRHATNCAMRHGLIWIYSVLKKGLIRVQQERVKYVT